MTQFEEEVINRIKTLVEDSGGKQKEIATQAGVSTSKMSKIMNPKKYKATVNIEDIANFAEVFDVSTDYLLTGADFGKREEVELTKKLDSFDLETCVLGLAQFVFISSFSLFNTPAGIFLEAYKYDENQPLSEILWQENRGEYDNPSLGFRKIEYSGNPAEEGNHRDMAIWGHLFNQVSQIASLEGFTNTEKYSMVKETVLPSIMRAYNLLPFTVFGHFHESANQDDELPF